MTTQGIFTIEVLGAYQLEVEYDYYWDDGDRETPPEDEVEVTKVTLNGMEITSFYDDFLEDSISEQLYEYAQENKHN